MRSSRTHNSGSQKDLSHYHRPQLETYSTTSESPQPILVQRLPISRREIIRRCSKTEEDSVTKYNGSFRSRWRQSPALQENSQSHLNQISSFCRPTTLPSVRKRLSNKESSGYPRKVSRHEIIKRKSGSDDLEGSHRKKSYSGLDGEFRDNPRTPFVKNVSGFSRSRILARSREKTEVDDSRSVCDFGNSRRHDVETLVPRPSTLPKTSHSSKCSRYKEDQSLARSNMELGIKEAPIYGRIRRKKASLPNVSRYQNVSRKASSRYSEDTRKQVTESRDSFSTSEISFQRKTYRSIRDPVSNPVYKPRSLLDMKEVDRKENFIHRTATSSRDFQGKDDGRKRQDIDNEISNPDDVCTVHRTMSRRRIISNIENVRDSKNLSRMKPKNFLQPENEDEVHAHTLPGTSCDLERVKRRRSLLSEKNCRNFSGDNATKEIYSKSKSSRISGCTLKAKNPDRFSWSRSIMSDLDSKTSFLEFTGNHGEKAASRTLPTYMKKSRASHIPLRIDSRTQNIGHNSTALKLTKERTNQVGKSVNSLARTCNDGKGVRSNSPGISTSIFSFCTGKRKVLSRIPSKIKDNLYRGHTLRTVR